MGDPFKELDSLSFNSERRFGVELEILAFDGKNRPAGGEKEKPAGADYVTALVKSNTDENVEWRFYEHTSKNDCWVVKPDSSCGLEICTPIYRGWRGIKKVCTVVESFKKDSKINVDSRCSVHLHVDVSNLSETEVASIIIHWVKCEAVFLDMVPAWRKCNRYCQFMCARDNFSTDVYLSPMEIIEVVGDVKYYTANTDQWRRTDGKRRTLEFRIIEGDGCKDPYLIKNWLRLMLHFVEMTSRMPLPKPYREGDQWSWVCMLDTFDVFRVLGFFPGQYELSNGLKQTRDWMLSRLFKYMTPDVDFGPRWKAYSELKELAELLRSRGQFNCDTNHLHPENLSEALYNEDYRF